MALLCSTIVLGQSINESFHTIREHYRPIVNDTKDKGQELAFDSVAIKDSMTVDSAQVMNTDYSDLSIEQLEELIIFYENYLHKKRESSTLIRHNNQQVLSYYTGDSHKLTLANLIDVIEEVGLSNQLFVLAQAGLYDSKHKDYYRFARWEDSVVGYQKFIQYRYKGGNYLQFLKRIGYAEDSRYTTTVAKIATQLYKRLFTQ